MGDFTAFYQHLVMEVILELLALLKFEPKAHPKLQAMVIDI